MLAARPRRRVSRLRGSIFLVAFCCRLATHRDRASQNSRRNRNGRLSVLVPSYEAVNVICLCPIVFNSLRNVPPAYTRVIWESAIVLQNNFDDWIGETTLSRPPLPFPARVS